MISFRKLKKKIEQEKEHRIIRRLEKAKEEAQRVVRLFYLEHPRIINEALVFLGGRDEGVQREGR